MAFDQSTITAASAVVHGTDLLVSWSSSAPAGTTFQVYVGRRLAWSGRARSCVLPMPQVRVAVDVGAVGPSEGSTDFSGSLPSAPASHAQLTWTAGAYLAGSLPLAGFHIYGEATPGGGIVYSTPLATVAAYPAGVRTDGWNQGGYDTGGYGSIPGSYSWTSGPLAGGTWAFAVKPYDAAGNEGTAATTSVVIAAPPRPPAANAAGKRLTYVYNATTRIATLSWLASPA